MKVLIIEDDFSYSKIALLQMICAKMGIPSVIIKEETQNKDLSKLFEEIVLRKPPEIPILEIPIFFEEAKKDKEDISRNFLSRPSVGASKNLYEVRTVRIRSPCKTGIFLYNKNMNKVIFSLVLLGIIVVPFFTLAQDESKTVSFKVYPGWNLIGAGKDREQNLFNEAQYVYVYIPVVNKYLPVKPESDSEKTKIQNDIKNAGLNVEDIDSRIRGAHWYYFPTEKTITFTVNSRPHDKLFSGWNFRYVEPWMVGYKLSEVLGTCSVKKMYGFNAMKQSDPWMLLNETTTDTLDPGDVGAGFVVNTTSECVLGLKSPKVPALPTLPN